MNIILIFLIVIVGIAFLVFILSFIPRKCPKCHKRSVYRSDSQFIGKKTEMRSVTTERQTKDKKGQLVKETITKQEPYEYSEYSVKYICGNCKHIFYKKSRTKEKIYSNYDEFKKSKKLGYIVSSVIFSAIFGILLGCLINNIVKENNRSNQEKMQDFLNESGNNNGTSYTCYDIVENNLVKGELLYQNSGFQLNNSSYDYRFKITNYPVDSLHANSVEAGIFFSLETDYIHSFVALSAIQYSANSTMACAYLGISGDDYFNLTYVNSTFLPSDRWETTYDVYEDEWEFYSWHAIKVSFLMLEDVCDSAGFDIYQIY